LKDQVDVRVLPGSLVPMSRDAIQAKITAICQLFPGYLSPEAAISAMENGTGEEIIQDYENHVARANRIIQRVKDGTMMDMPTTINPKAFELDPEGHPAGPLPGWMPRPFDRTEIHKHVFETFLTTEEWELLPIEQPQRPPLLRRPAPDRGRATGPRSRLRRWRWPSRRGWEELPSPRQACTPPPLTTR
jgi:hypothetical protein